VKRKTRTKSEIDEGLGGEERVHQKKVALISKTLDPPKISGRYCPDDEVRHPFIYTANRSTFFIEVFVLFCTASYGVNGAAEVENGWKKQKT
jgi:hypothetical protein